MPRRALWAHRLRRLHGWVGLWGAVLGLSFGLSGIWLNHRNVLKLPPVAQARGTAHIALPEPAPATPAALAEWARAALQVEGAPATSRVEPAKAVAWTDKADKMDKGTSSAASVLMQPERWTFSWGGPNASTQLEYWRGNKSASVTTTSNGFIATLTNMHKGSGMPLAWILLVDTLAGSIIFLSLTGVALWMLTNRRRVVGFTVMGVSLAVYAAIVGSALAG